MAAPCPNLQIVWRNPQPVQRRRRWEALETGSSSCLYVIQEFLSTGEHGFWNTTCHLRVLPTAGARRSWHQRTG
jgi:hypothetical protein